MAEVDLVPGSRFRLYRADDAGSFGYVCLATTLSLVTTRAVSQDGAAIGDKWSRFLPGLRGWSLDFAGRVSPGLFTLIEADQQADALHLYRIVTDAASGRSYTGPLIVESLSRGMSERGFLAFEASCRGAGALTFT